MARGASVRSAWQGRRPSGRRPVRREPRRRAPVKTRAFGGETLVRLAADLIARKFRLQAIEVEHVVRPVVLGFDGPARLELEESLGVAAHCVREIDPAAAQFDSMNEATFTASAQMSKAKRRLPTTPEMTGPV